MSLGQILDRDLINNLAVFIASRQWKNAKELAKGISRFQLDNDEGTFVSSGWPIGKVESEKHFKECCQRAKAKGKFYNVSTGLLKKPGFPSYVYGDGWCVPRGCPEHIALEKVIDIKEQQFDVDVNDDGWPVLKNTDYIWDCDKDRVVGSTSHGGHCMTLTNKDQDYLRSKNIPFYDSDMQELRKLRL